MDAGKEAYKMAKVTLRSKRVTLSGKAKNAAEKDLATNSLRT